MCRVFRVSSSSYYEWVARPESARDADNRRLLDRIMRIHEESRRTYGVRRIRAGLLAEGEKCSKNRVARLMKENDISSKRKRKFRVTTDSRHSYPVAENLLDRQFEVSEPDRVWVSDITYIPTDEGWLYLATVMDLYSRKITGWSMSERVAKELTIDALMMATERRSPSKGLIHHSDRGSQYASNEYRKRLTDSGMLCSMSRKGDPWDNAPIESFFGTLKSELVHHARYRSREEARRDIFEYIEVFYNRKRLHSSLGNTTPDAFESSYYLNYEQMAVQAA